jgi:hypothetical protein
LTIWHRREIIQYAIRLIFFCVHTLLSHTYISLTFLMMYGTMWSIGIKFDTRFFALAACMLAYMRLSIVEFFNYAVRNLVYYLAAKKRIEVSMKICYMENISLELIDISSC